MKRWLRSIKRECLEWWRAILRAVPGEIGCYLRRAGYGFATGPNSRVLQHVMIYYPERLRLGSDVGIAAGCQINAAGGIDIGDDVLIGPGCHIWSQNHRIEGRRVIREQAYERKRVVLGRDVWLGAGTIVLPGVTIAEGTVVAAGAVVTKDTEPYSLVAGVPARKIRSRLADERIAATTPEVQCHAANGVDEHG